LFDRLEEKIFGSSRITTTINMECVIIMATTTLTFYAFSSLSFLLLVLLQLPAFKNPLPLPLSLSLPLPLPRLDRAHFNGSTIEFGLHLICRDCGGEPLL
jgi:hypothetical protein